MRVQRQAGMQPLTINLTARHITHIATSFKSQIKKKDNPSVIGNLCTGSTRQFPGGGPIARSVSVAEPFPKKSIPFQRATGLPFHTTASLPHLSTDPLSET
jgi:hypothetical protein